MLDQNMSVEKLESMVIRKTNRFVYLSNGTHMTYSDFHRYKQDLRKELQCIIAEQHKNSIKMVVTSLQEITDLENMLHMLKAQKSIIEDEIDDHHNTDWEKHFRQQCEVSQELKDKLNSHARKLYANLAELPILKTYTNDKGIKFLIQKNDMTDEYRFCFDPYELGANFHTQLNEFFSGEKWNAINGGWMKVFNDKVILYKSSGDYGVYDDTIAIECAKKIFTNKVISSFAGKEWNDTMYD